MALKFQKGAVVFVSQLPDENGVNSKDRPIVLIRDHDDSETVAYGVAISGEFDYPLPNSSILLPYHREGRCKSGLTKESVAVCSWVVIVSPKDFLGKVGFIPSTLLQKILEQVQVRISPPSTP